MSKNSAKTVLCKITRGGHEFVLTKIQVSAIDFIYLNFQFFNLKLRYRFVIWKLGYNNHVINSVWPCGEMFFVCAMPVHAKISWISNILKIINSISIQSIRDLTTITIVVGMGFAHIHFPLLLGVDSSIVLCCAVMWCGVVIIIICHQPYSCLA